MLSDLLYFERVCWTPAGRDLVNMAKKRPNIIPIIEDARHPQKYRMLVPMVDVVFAGAFSFAHFLCESCCSCCRKGRELLTSHLQSAALHDAEMGLHLCRCCTA